MSYSLTRVVNLGASRTGLTLQSQLKPAGGAAAAAVTTGIVELAAGSGTYEITVTPATGFQGSAIISKTPGTGGEFQIAFSIDPTDEPASSGAAQTRSVEITDIQVS